MESAIFFGVGVIIGAVLVLSTFVFQRWYESYSFAERGVVPLQQIPYDQVDMPDMPTEEYFSQAQKYSFDDGHELGEPDMSDEALERYARQAGIDFGGDIDV